MRSDHNHNYDGKTCRICSIIADEREKEWNRMRRPAELASIINGEDWPTGIMLLRCFP